MPIKKRANTNFSTMKVLVCQLIYGTRPHNILVDNELKAGYNATYCNINTEGIANALNEGIEFMMLNDYDAVAFLAICIKRA